MTALVLFRDDLRVTDQPALAAAAGTGEPVACLYLFDEGTPGLRPPGGASRWWLHGSLSALGASLKALGGELVIARGPQADVIPAIADALRVTSVHWNRRFGGSEREPDDALASALRARGVEVSAHNGNLLRDPDDLLTKTGGGFKVFTPFWRALQLTLPPAAAAAAPSKLRPARWPAKTPFRCALADLALLPTRPDWAGGLRDVWKPGEAGAHERLDLFLTGTIDGYAEARNLPDKRGSSQLSPHLRHGELSPRQVWRAALDAREAGAQGSDKDWETFFKELAWREFSYHLLARSPEIATRDLKPGFEAFPHRDDAGERRAWQQGRTGYPIVDAGMRQLWRTGWMHNRIRMVAASFLIKHLLTDWRRGEEWFWDTLVDADPANNAASWQWIAGTGVDAAPYFRVFNPVLQGQTYDPRGGYVRRFVPELARLPDRYIHAPWTAPTAVLAKAGIVLGRDYPHPIVAHGEARARALAAYRSLRAAAS